MSGLVAEEIQNEVDGVDDLPDNSNEALEAEAKAAIAAQPTMHQGTSTLQTKLPSKKELEAKEAQRKEDAGENDLQDDLEVNNSNLEAEGKAVMAMS